jgi:hypothetical protein
MRPRVRWRQGIHAEHREGTEAGQAGSAPRALARLRTARAMGKRLLVADVPQLEPRVARALGAQRIVYVHRLPDALKALAQDDFAGVLIGMHFDDSRMFDLLRELRSASRNRDVPALCYRMRPLAFRTLSSAAIETTVMALGGRGFLDLANSQDEEHADRALAAAAAALTESG